MGNCAFPSDIGGCSPYILPELPRAGRGRGEILRALNATGDGSFFDTSRSSARTIHHGPIVYRLPIDGQKRHFFTKPGVPGEGAAADHEYFSGRHQSRQIACDTYPARINKERN